MSVRGSSTDDGPRPGRDGSSTGDLDPARVEGAVPALILAVDPTPPCGAGPAPTGDASPAPIVVVDPEPTGNAGPAPIAGAVPVSIDVAGPEPACSVDPVPTGDADPEPTGVVQRAVPEEGPDATGGEPRTCGSVR